MKYTLLFLMIVCAPLARGQEAVAPRFQGGEALYFSRRMAGEAEKIVAAKQIPASELSPLVFVALEIDTAGRVSAWRFLDNTCEGRDKVDAAPATARTREVLEEAYALLEGGWTAGTTADGRPLNYTMRLGIRLPIEKIARAQEADPLLFLGEAPEKSFHAWARLRIHPERFDPKGAAGDVHVRFWVEPDGRITIGEVLKSDDERIAKEVVRAIRQSRGKWTPRKVRGVPQRTEWTYRYNYS